jgi:hypothetical protein
MDEAQLDAVRGRLKTNSVKLWEPPYYDRARDKRVSLEACLPNAVCVHALGSFIWQRLRRRQAHGRDKLLAWPMTGGRSGNWATIHPVCSPR